MSRTINSVLIAVSIIAAGTIGFGAYRLTHQRPPAPPIPATSAAADEPEVLAALPNCAIVAPAAGGIPVAFGIREALNADQIFWAEKDEGRYYFRQYLNPVGIKCILVDDVVRSGKVTAQMIQLIRDAGASVVAVGSLVHFKDAQMDTGDIPYYALLEVETQFLPTSECPQCRRGEPVEKVWV